MCLVWLCLVSTCSEAASVAGMCQTAIRTMERAQVVRSASYPAGNGFEAAKRSRAAVLIWHAMKCTQCNLLLALFNAAT